MSDEYERLKKDVLEPIAESCELQGLFEKASEQMRAELAADPEWNTAKYVHVHFLVEAFAIGVISADCWHHGYKLPPNFESVVNYIADRIQRHWPKEEVVQVSLIEIEALFREWAFEHPDFRAWNDTKPGAPMVGVVSRYSSTPDERDFIDLGALLRNAAIALRSHHRINDDFDRRHPLEADVEC
jgi:hypothetical protein